MGIQARRLLVPNPARGGLFIERHAHPQTPIFCFSAARNLELIACARAGCAPMYRPPRRRAAEKQKIICAVFWHSINRPPLAGLRKAQQTDSRSLRSRDCAQTKYS